MSFLDPNGLHVGDSIDGETIVAYGYAPFDTDDLQAVLTLLPKTRQSPATIRQTTPDPGGHSNYCTFLRNDQGQRFEIEYHSNIVHAANRYSNDLGMEV